MVDIFLAYPVDTGSCDCDLISSGFQAYELNSHADANENQEHFQPDRVHKTTVKRITGHKRAMA